MVYTETQLSDLRKRVKGIISEKRFNHTLGVERAATELSAKILPEKASEVKAAAILHDLTKEYSDAKHLEIIRSANRDFSDSDLMSPPIFHSLSAPSVIERDFPEFYTEDIVSAIYNHTTGDPEMSVFDEIIFIADYIEEGRTYPLCVQLRKQLLGRISTAKSSEECVSLLHDAVIRALENTIIALVERGSFLHEKTVMTRNAFLARRPMMLY